MDFDSCHEPVILMKTSHGNFSEVHRTQFKDVHARSAVSVYLLRKQDSGQLYDIKGVMQIGSHYTRPYGQDTGRLVVHTNQVNILEWFIYIPGLSFY